MLTLKRDRLLIRDSTGELQEVQTIQGADGHTPERGVDYWTELDVSTINSYINTKTNNKQDTLESGTNIKTINGNTILGSGDLTLDTGKIDDVQVNGVSVVTNKIANIVLEGGSSVTSITDEEIDTIFEDTSAVLGQFILGVNTVEEREIDQ